MSHIGFILYTNSDILHHKLDISFPVFNILSLKKNYYAPAYLRTGSYALADSCRVLDRYSVLNAPKSGLKALDLKSGYYQTIVPSSKHQRPDFQPGF